MAQDTQRLDIYGPIGLFGIDADSVRRRMREFEPGSPLDVHIHSPGGEVFDGAAILTNLLRHDGLITVYIDGLAASIASAIAMAGDVIVASPLSSFYIHRPWSFAVGYAEVLEDEARALRKLEPMLRSAYDARWSGTSDELDSAFQGDGEWWMGREIVEAGFADRIEDLSPPDEGDGVVVDFSAYAKTPPREARETWGPSEARPAAAVWSPIPKMETASEARQRINHRRSLIASLWDSMPQVRERKRADGDGTEETANQDDPETKQETRDDAAAGASPGPGETDLAVLDAAIAYATRKISAARSRGRRE